jgi:hypothetical protein
MQRCKKPRHSHRANPRSRTPGCGGSTSPRVWRRGAPHVVLLHRAREQDSRALVRRRAPHPVVERTADPNARGRVAHDHGRPVDGGRAAAGDGTGIAVPFVADRVVPGRRAQLEIQDGSRSKLLGTRGDAKRLRVRNECRASVDRHGAPHLVVQHGETHARGCLPPCRSRRHPPPFRPQRFPSRCSSRRRLQWHPFLIRSHLSRRR